MRYLALDQALQTSGWAIFNNGDLIEYGTFKTKNFDPIEKRLHDIWNELNELADKYEFDYVFFEDIQQQRNAETYKKLAYVQAAIFLWCYWIENVEYMILSPSHWRSLLKDKYKVNFGKNRVEQKKAAQELIEQLYKLKVTQDEADAICIGLAGYSEYNKIRSAF